MKSHVEAAALSMPLLMQQIIAPLGVLRSLYDNTSTDEARALLYRTVHIEHDTEQSRLISTDTHLLCVVTTPSLLPIEAGTYRFFQRPGKHFLAGMGQALLTKFEGSGEFPKIERVIPDPKTQEPVGEYKWISFGQMRLSFNRLVSINANYLKRLAPADYVITGTKHTEKDYWLKPLRFEGELDGWKLLYMFMPMQPGNLIEHEAFQIHREVIVAGRLVARTA